jgi:glycosyltransferase involved in cell wall biosynthesis
VAVVVPTIPGRERYLHRALASVHAQDRPPDQIVVERDDDRTGAAQTRNRALERVTADAVAWLDDDDQFKPNHLKVCGRVLHDHPETTLVYPRPVMHPVGSKDPTATRYQGVFPVSPWGLRWCPELADHLRNVGSFIPMTHLVRTAAVRDAGGFPEGRTLADGRYQGEDERYLISLLDHGAVFEHIARPTWWWTVNPRSTAGRGLALRDTAAGT